MEQICFSKSWGDNSNANFIDLKVLTAQVFKLYKSYKPLGSNKKNSSESSSPQNEEENKSAGSEDEGVVENESDKDSDDTE